MITYAIIIITKRGTSLELYACAASAKKALQIAADYWQRHNMAPYISMSAVALCEEATI